MCVDNAVLEKVTGVCFEDNMLEIALCTFNRPTCLMKQLEYSYMECIKRNIVLRVVDASTNTESENYVKQFNVDKENKVLYTRVDSSTPPGYMQMQAIMTSSTEYIWVYADSRRVDFDEFDAKVFPIIYKGIELITFFDFDFMPDSRFYSDCSEFIQDCFVPFTCTGCSIYKREIFDCFGNDSELYEKCNLLFRDNYAFSWIGYTLYALSKKREAREYYCNVKIMQVDNKKKRTWIKHFYRCWIDDILSIVDNLPSEYINARDILQKTWKQLKLDSDMYCYICRTQGDLNRDSFMHYYNEGLLFLTGGNIKKIKFYACAPILIVSLYYIFVRGKGKLFRIINKIR